MLLEMAVADAYAIPFEFVDHTADRPWDLTQYWQHPKYSGLRPGQYTDDTQRAIANILVMLSGRYLDARAYVESYLSTFKRDPRDGYSRRYQQFLESVNTPDDFLKEINRTADSNGSLMGVAPVGYLKNIQDVKLAATIQAITTHHPDTAIHAQVVALAAHYMIHHSGTRNGLRQFLILQPDWSNKEEQYYRWIDHVDSWDRGLGTTMKASSISSYMLYAIEKFDKLSDIIKDAIQRGGDTDSAAATTVAIASCCPEIENDLPEILIDGLEDGSFGRQFLIDLDKKLVEVFS